MPYCLPRDVRLAVAPSVDDPNNPPPRSTGTAADLDNATLTAAISQADSIIDANLGGRYSVPIVPGTDGISPPHPIDFWSIAFASYLATLTYRKNQDLEPNDPVALRFAMARTDLTNAARGTITLNLPGQGGGQAVVGAGNVINPYVGTLFTDADFKLEPTPWSADVGTPGGWNGRWY